METKERLEAAAAGGLILPEIIDVPHLAVALRRTEGGIRALFRRGALPGVKLGREWVITRRELMRALAPSDVTPRFELVPSPDGEGAGDLPNPTEGEAMEPRLFALGPAVREAIRLVSQAGWKDVPSKQTFREIVHEHQIVPHRVAGLHRRLWTAEQIRKVAEIFLGRVQTVPAGGAK